MSSISGNYNSNYYNSYVNNSLPQSKGEAALEQKSKNIEALQNKSDSRVSDNDSLRKPGSYGKTIGNAKLSEEGAKYYEELKKKYGNLDFILVSKDQKENAKAHASSFANANRMVVLIDEDKIERMATDENFRKQYEGIIENAASGLNQLKTSMENSGQSANVKGYGMTISDKGIASFFAVLQKSSDAQKERIEKKAEQNKADKKAAEKKAEKKEEEKKLQDSRVGSDMEDDDTITITADSVEELMQKISDYNFNYMSNNVQTQQEKMRGQHIDFRG